MRIFLGGAGFPFTVRNIAQHDKAASNPILRVVALREWSSYIQKMPFQTVPRAQNTKGAQVGLSAGEEEAADGGDQPLSQSLYSRLLE